MVRCKSCEKKRIRCSQVVDQWQERCSACVQRDIACIPSRGRKKVLKVSMNPGGARRIQLGTSTMAEPPIVLPPIVNQEQRGQSLVKLLVSIDAGTAYVKACWRAFYPGDNLKPRLCHDFLISSLRPVTWSNNETLVPNQLAFLWSDSQGNRTFRQIWGDDVTLAVQQREISSGQVFRFIKPVLYGDEILNVADQERLEGQIEALPDFIKYSRQDESNPGSLRKLECLDLYSDALGHAYRHVLKAVKEEIPTLSWPSWSDYNQYRDFDPTTCTQIELVLPVPACSRPEHVQLALTAAKMAGLPEPFPVAEPAAAYAFDVQTSFERSGRPMEPDCKIIVDVGCGSADIQAWRVVDTAPFKLREEVRGDAGWVGGRSVNKACVRVVQRACMPHMKEILSSMAMAGYPKTEADFLDAVEEQFELEKRRFIGYGENEVNGVVLQIPGLPVIPGVSWESGKLVLSKDDVIQIFSSSINTICAKINGIIHDFHMQNSEQGRLCKHVKLMLLVGGGSASPHLREQMKRYYETSYPPAAGYPIPVKTPNGVGVGGVTSIALGALLMLMDKPFMGERVIRRGYCVTWDQDADPEKGYPPGRVVQDLHDGVRRETDVTKFLIRIGERVEYHHEVRNRRGWRGLFLDEAGPQGWTIIETIYYSDFTSKDGLWVHDLTAEIHEAGPLKFLLSPDECRDFEVRYAIDGGRSYKYCEYEVALLLEGIVMHYRVTIPRSGRFQGDDEEGGGYGENPIEQAGSFDCGGVFKLFNTS